MPIAEGVRVRACRRAWTRTEPRRKGFFAKVHEFKGFVGAREEVMDDRMYLRSGGIGPSARPHAQARANTSRTYYNARRSDVCGPFSGPAVLMKFSWGTPPTRLPGCCRRWEARKTAKGPCCRQARAHGRVKTLKLLSFHFPAAVTTSRERTGVNKMRELVNLTARRPFPAPPRRPFSQPRRQINEVRYICASPHTTARKRAYTFSLPVRVSPSVLRSN